MGVILEGLIWPKKDPNNFFLIKDNEWFTDLLAFKERNNQKIDQREKKTLNGNANKKFNKNWNNKVW